MFDVLILWLKDMVQGVFDWLLSVWDVVKEWILAAFFAVFDSVLSVFEAIIDAIPVPDALNIPSLWSWTNPQTQWILEHLQITAVLGIILAAWGIRFALNLIPSWATRV